MRAQRKITVPVNSTGGTTIGDTGFLSGALHQLLWSPVTPDTGQSAAVSVALIPTRSGDTGTGFNIYAETLNMGAVARRAPRLPAHDASGNVLDTGGDESVPAFGDNDRLRFKIIPGDTGMVLLGSLHCWVGDL